MSKSDDNTNELDSYGVWVKNTPSKEQSQLDEQKDDLGIDDTGLDLPDFDDNDFSDMFKDEPQHSVDVQGDDFGNDMDSTLSTDELANITSFGDVAIENVEAPVVVDDFNDSDSTFEDIVDDITSTDGSSDITPNTGIADDDLPDFSMFPDNDNVEEASNNNQEEEISIDDFMDDGFSDESVASGNNGYEPGAKKAASSNDTEDVDLDDFLDSSSFDEAPVENKEESSEDEKPIDMDISFDDSIDNVETESNASLDNDVFDYEEEPEDTIETEDATDEFMNDSNEDKTIVSEDTFTPDTSNIDTEDVDLSDFGIDSDAEETPIVQDVENDKKKSKVVDYDLFVENNETSSAPVVNEIKTKKAEEETKEDTSTTTIDNDLLKQIVADLSSLKDEIKSIKSNIAEIKEREERQNKKQEVADDTTVADDDTFENVDVVEETTNDIPIPEVIDENELADETIVEDKDTENETVAADDSTVADDFDIDVNEETTSDEIPLPDTVTDDELSDDDFTFEAANADDIFVQDGEDTGIPESKDEGGFFGSDDTDDTIALSGDELSNILSNADFSESIDFADDQTNEEEMPDEIDIPKTDDIYVESTDNDFMDSVRDTTNDIPETPEDFDDFDDMTMEGESFDSIEDVPENLGNVLDDDDSEVPTVDKELEQEPVEEKEEVAPETEETITDETVANEDETLSDDSDLEETELSFDDVDFLNAGDFTENDATVSEDNPIVADENSTTLEDITTENAPVDTEETVKEEPEIVEETVNPEIEETAIDDTDFDDNFAEVDNLDNNLTSSNLNYLTKDDDTETTEADANGDLKKEIKSVLLYMDQLLESLPEEKIYEFAKSEEFATYKKLFKDLGLS